MPALGRGPENRPLVWLLSALITFTAAGLILLQFTFKGSAQNSLNEVRDYTRDDWSHIPWGIDADTWASQHKNYTPHHQLLTRDSSDSQVHTCKKDQPCSNGACCGPSGYCGFGDVYCGTGCMSNCDATAPCGNYSSTGDATCPLNVCCSQYGFCGTTSDFCGTGCQSNCRTPSSPGFNGDVRSTIIGYWESWTANTQYGEVACQAMPPNDVPIEALTGLNFAFASIRPDTYDIVPMSGVSTDLYAKITDLKKQNPDAKIYVSVGGWTFSDNGTSTQPLFGDISSTLIKRFKFATKLHAFMVEYGFDGVDFDWEYPGAGDRGGTEADVLNYPLLLEAVKYKFKVEKAAFGVTFTAPTSYWYLRWFDLPSLMKYADMVNLMTYDLHGVWDENDDLGPYVYAHTNLTEIDAALSLLWRNNVSPTQVNLGLAFYGRTYTLEDPTCMSPGCSFKGKGNEGACTATAGMLSFREIEDIIASQTCDVIYDPVAGINYMVYDSNQWVSFDDKTTFQQKIDFANQNGLNGLFIWAIDLDDSTYTALKAVTGRDLTPSIGESSTLGYFNVDKCFITACGSDCPDGFTTLTGLNLDNNGKGCSNSGKDKTQRSLCCPAWGSPNPSSCEWHGSGPHCYGQCAPGEVTMATDNYGGSSYCDNGYFKAFCCPATSGASAVAQCRTEKGASFLGNANPCPSDYPQQIAKIGTSNGQRNYCCPSEPSFSNCAWHGDFFTCGNNRCPIGQIEMTRDVHGDGGISGNCVFGRQKVLCCDPPFNGTAFIPVSLDDLFPETLPSADAPIYYESIKSEEDTGDAETPDYTGFEPDPNREPFAWTIMVGSEEDVQSLRKRDGSHLELFDCPEPYKTDFGKQTIRAVCMVDGDDHNCEDITLGSVEGTIIRLPEDCGPDEWVRVVSFRQIENHPLPSNLFKRLQNSPKVYEIKYDYNFRKLRRDGGEIYVRFDASVHPGYWDEIVASSPNGPIKRRSDQDWRAFHMEWFENHKINKRGWGIDGSWWRDRFEALLNRNYNYGLSKTYQFSQTLYSAGKNCEPYGTIGLDVSCQGYLKTTLDFGITLIGTLRDFDFSESYAYFNLYNLGVKTEIVIDGRAGFQFESQVLQLLDKWDPWGGSFNIKGLWTIGPYFDATAHLQALATISGRVSVGLEMTTDERNFTYMFPQSLGQFPTENDIKPWQYAAEVTPGAGATMASDGSVMVSVTPSIGFQIKLNALDQELVNTDISVAFLNMGVLRVGALSEDCEGFHYQVDYTLDVSISVKDPLPGFAIEDQAYWVSRGNVIIKPWKCYPWNLSSKRELPGPEHNETALVPRSSGNFNTLFPDTWASALSCPQDTNTTTGPCKVDISPDDYWMTSDSVYSKRDLPDEDEDGENNFQKRDLHNFDKRSSSKKSTICAWKPTNRQIQLKSRAYPSSGDMIKDKQRNSFTSYGPQDPTDCNSYDFGTINTPSSGVDFAAEHVLEWQMLKDFWNEQLNTWGRAQSFLNPSSNPSAADMPTTNSVDACDYFKFWWDTKSVSAYGMTAVPMQILTSAFPGTDFNRKEFMLLDRQTNSMKEGLWGDHEIRTETTMMGYLQGQDLANPTSKNYRDVQWAINACRYVMYAMEYIDKDDVAGVLVDQATRIGEYFDDMETKLYAIAQNGFNKAQYQKQDFGMKWRKFIYQRFELQAQSASNFVSQWAPTIQLAYRSSELGQDAMGGVETNDLLLKQIDSLITAWEAFPDVFDNPFPLSWK